MIFIYAIILILLVGLIKWLTTYYCYLPLTFTLSPTFLYTLHLQPLFFSILIFAKSPPDVSAT